MAKFPKFQNRLITLILIASISVALVFCCCLKDIVWAADNHSCCSKTNGPAESFSTPQLTSPSGNHHQCQCLNVVSLQVRSTIQLKDVSPLFQDKGLGLSLIAGATGSGDVSLQTNSQSAPDKTATLPDVLPFYIAYSVLRV